MTAVHPPRAPHLSASKRRRSGSALNAFCFPRTAIAALLLAFALPVMAGVREVSIIGLTVGNLDKEVAFYTNTLPFHLTGISDVSGPGQDRLFGLNNARLRVAELKLGGERITLTEHLTNKGRPIPPDSLSYDLWFQHIAIVVRDMDKAYEQLRQHRVKYVSTAPQTLPAWNKNAGGIQAFYFRDPENHVLEIIHFPPGKGDPKWQQPTTNLFLGIDHTAIVVSDTERSLQFYRNLLGLRVAGESENYGVEQEHLNQVFGARLRITGLRAERGPGIEFLEYITPPGGRPLPQNANASDLIFWTTHLIADDAMDLTAECRAYGMTFVSAKENSSHSQIVRDPDGHALEIDDGSPTTPTSARR